MRIYHVDVVTPEIVERHTIRCLKIASKAVDESNIYSLNHSVMNKAIVMGFIACKIFDYLEVDPSPSSEKKDES